MEWQNYPEATLGMKGGNLRSTTVAGAHQIAEAGLDEKVRKFLARY